MQQINCQLVRILLGRGVARISVRGLEHSSNTYSTKTFEKILKIYIKFAHKVNIFPKMFKIFS